MPAKDLIYWGSVAASALLLIAAIAQISTVGRASDARVNDPQLDTVGTGTPDLTNALQLFGNVPPPPPNTRRMPTNVFEPVKLTGVLWRGSAENSWVVLEHRGAFHLRRVDTGLDDGSLVIDVGADYAVLARAGKDVRLTFTSALDVHANPWAGTRDDAEDRSPRHEFDRVIAAEQGLVDAVALFAHTPRPPPPAREVRRRAASGRDAGDDPRLRQLRSHQPELPADR